MVAADEVDQQAAEQDEVLETSATATEPESAVVSETPLEEIVLTPPQTQAASQTDQAKSTPLPEQVSDQASAQVSDEELSSEPAAVTTKGQDQVPADQLSGKAADQAASEGPGLLSGAGRRGRFGALVGSALVSTYRMVRPAKPNAKLASLNTSHAATPRALGTVFTSKPASIFGRRVRLAPDPALKTLPALHAGTPGKWVKGLVKKTYPWLRSINPRFGRGPEYATNCVLTAVATDQTIRTGKVRTAGPSSVSPEYLLEQYTGQKLRTATGFGQITNWMINAGRGSAGLVVVYTKGNEIGHVFNVTYGEHGVVFLDGQTGKLAVLPDGVSELKFVPSEGTFHFGEKGEERVVASGKVPNPGLSDTVIPATVPRGRAPGRYGRSVPECCHRTGARSP